MALVSYESVVEAAEALIANGQKASVRNVIKQIGGGSPNTVAKLLNEFKAGRPVFHGKDLTINDNVMAAIKLQMQEVARDAALTAEEKATALQDDNDVFLENIQSLEKQIEQLTADLASANEQVQALATAKGLIEDKASRDHELAQSKITELSADLHDERERSAAAQVALGKLQAKADAVPLLEALIAKLQGELDQERKERAAADQRTAVAEAQIKLVNEQVAKTAAAAEKADKEHKESITQIREDLTEARQATRDVQAELRDARALTETLRSELTNAKADIVLLTPREQTAAKKSK